MPTWLAGEFCDAARPSSARSPPASALGASRGPGGARRHPLGISRRSFGLGTVHTARAPAPASGSFSLCGSCDAKGLTLCVRGRGSVWGDSHAEDTLARGRAGLVQNNEVHPRLAVAKPRSLLPSHLPAPAMNPSPPQPENTVSPLAATLNSILEMLAGSRCQLFNAEWEEEE